MRNHSRQHLLAGLAGAALAALLALGLAGCGEPAEDDRLLVATSVLPHAGLVERIGGERVRVAVLVRPGESPATHQPTDAQVSEVLRAKAWFRTGVPFERGAWLDLLADTPGLEIVDLRAGVPLRSIEAHSCGDPSHGHEGHDCETETELPELDLSADPRWAERAATGPLDPHIWTEPRILEVQARAIARTLKELDPEGREVYAAGLEAVLADLADVQSELARVLAPVEGRTLYVFHPAWGYLCDAYGIGQRAIEIEGKEPSESELTELVTAARDDDIRAVFVQSQITGQTARAVADAVGARLVKLDPLAKDVVANLREVGRVLAENL